jgi:eukaryotic-like serine/threonine-protein kinase
MALLVLDRYELWSELASGGMATVYLGRLRGERGFARPVAIKRLHKHIAKDPEFVAAFLDEARLAARVRHPNVVSTLDVLDRDGEIFVVMDYVHGESLARIRAKIAADGKKIPLSIAGAIASGLLQGLHAAHEAKDEHGTPLAIVHRDVSPQNVIIGADGVARVVDFGVAKAEGRLQSTTEGAVKGKAAYMAPEQINGRADRRTDIFAASAVLWELLTGRRLFLGNSTAETLANVLAARVPPPRSIEPSISEALEELVMAGLDPIPDRRFATAREMDQALKRCLPIASTFDVAEWLEATTGDVLSERTMLVTAMETSSGAPAPAAASADARDALAVDDGSVTVHVPEEPPRRGRRPLVVTLLTMGIALVVLGGLYLRSGAARGERTAALTLPEAGDVDAAVGTAPLVVLGSAATAKASAPVATPRPTPNFVAPSPARARGDAGSRARPPANNCDPPYWDDAKGRHFKENCPL